MCDTIEFFKGQYYQTKIFFSVPCEDDEERRGSLTTARRGSRLSDIIQMQVGDGGDGQDENDDVKLTLSTIFIVMTMIHLFL